LQITSTRRLPISVILSSSLQRSLETIRLLAQTKRLLAVHSNMRLFKGQNGRFRPRAGKPAVSRTEPQHDNRSIGSELAIHDQFDIIVHKYEEKGWKIFESDNSTVSSMATDDHRYSHYYSSSSVPSSAASSWCCCSGNTELTEETDNTLLLSRTQNYGSPTIENQSQPEWRLCGPRVQESQPESLNIDTTDNMVKLLETSDNKDIALFDSLSEEEGVEHYKHRKESGKRKWRSSLIRKAMLWKKKHTPAQREDDEDIAKESMVPLPPGLRENMPRRNTAAVIM
jgi:hypothetical protein